MKSPAPSRPQKMALIPACIFLCFAALSVQAEETPVTPQPPDILLGPLFNDVQNAKLFPDQKTFADAVPNSDPLMILADYRMQQNQSGFDLRHFVNVNFTLPKEGEKYVPPEGQSLREHIDGLWPVLTRSTENTEKWDSLLPLPEPYVVPGGRFREVYYWDSYFTMLGLAESGHWDKVADMVANFAHEIDTYGHIPNGNRSYYLSRSQPPFFALMVELLAQHEGDAALKQYLPQMQKEYAYWMDNPHQLNTLRTTSIVPVDLNSLMFKMEKILARASKAAGDNAMANQYETLANARQKGIEKYMWNDQQGWYADYDLKSHKVRNQLTAAALFPLYVNAAAKDRANKMATATKTHLLQPGGLNTTSVKSGQQWDAPNGWAPLQWVATEGLQNYGQKEVAMDISWHFLTNVQHTYDREKKLVEKYDVSTTGTGGGGGEYPLQDGFGWTNGVTLKMLDLICPKEQPCDNVPATRPTVKSATTQPSTKEAQPTP
ncbi:alpha,alpha-trehalase [Escherichia coli]|nr:alpha,alpha-trehalase [Escherichia coli]